MLQSYYRFGVAREKNVLKRHRDAYHGVVFSAHIASYYRKSCGELVASLGKPFLIDPFTFVFGRHPGIIRRTERDENKKIKRDRLGRKVKGSIKRSYAKLAGGEYGRVIEDVCKRKQSVTPRSFAKERDLRDFVSHVLQFQDDVFDVSAKYAKYAKYVGHETVLDNTPEALIAPYFYIDPLQRDEWLQLNVRLAHAARDLADEQRAVLGVLCLSKDDLRNLPAWVAQLIDEAGMTGVLVWVNDFRESDASDAHLAAFVDAVETIAEQGHTIGNLYAGGLSVLLGDHGVCQVSCGPCYGDMRSVDQDADDAVIPTRYYFEKLMKKILVDAFGVRDIEAHPDLRCDCQVCQMRGDVSKFDEEKCREHFVLARRREIERLSGQSVEELVAQVQSVVNEYSGDVIFEVPHLVKWARALGR
ncbi:MAG: hypothetical protein H6811_08730 [Phycisphaeraceae bacterium]|nr:hypothetical protein [Phycisphaeraceae bacterium]